MSSEPTKEPKPVLRVYEASLDNSMSRSVYVAATSMASATRALKDYFPNEEPRFMSCKGQLVCSHDAFPEGLPPDQYTSAVLKL